MVWAAAMEQKKFNKQTRKQTNKQTNKLSNIYSIGLNFFGLVTGFLMILLGFYSP